MINPELYHKTVGILFDAYFKDTLEHGNCYACAVGNIIAANNNIQFKRNNTWQGDREPWWLSAIWPGDGLVDLNFYSGDVKKQIDSTGYGLQDVARIEEAFERAPHGETDEDFMFNGLVAVLEVLRDIHQVTDQDLLTSNNNRFKEQYERRAVKIVL